MGGRLNQRAVSSDAADAGADARLGRACPGTRPPCRPMPPTGAAHGRSRWRRTIPGPRFGRGALVRRRGPLQPRRLRVLGGRRGRWRPRDLRLPRVRVRPADRGGRPAAGDAIPIATFRGAGRRRRTGGGAVIDLDGVTVETLERDPYPDLRRPCERGAGRLHAVPRRLDGHSLGRRRGRVRRSGRIPGARRALPDGPRPRRRLDDDHRRRAGQATSPAVRSHPAPAHGRGAHAGGRRAAVPRAARCDRACRRGRAADRLLRARLGAVARARDGHRRPRRRADPRRLVRRPRRRASPTTRTIRARRRPATRCRARHRSGRACRASRTVWRHRPTTSISRSRRRRRTVRSTSGSRSRCRRSSSSCWAASRNRPTAGRRSPHCLLRHPDQLAAVRGDAVPRPGRRRGRAALDGARSGICCAAWRPARPWPAWRSRPTLGRSSSCRRRTATASVWGPTADRFDITRPRQAHLSFATGPHYCIGHHFAKAQLRIAISMLFDRFPRLRLDPDHETVYRGHEYRSPKALRVLVD